MLATAGEEAIKIVPSLLWIGFAAAALLLFKKTIRDEVVPRLSSLRLPGGIELVLRDKIAAAAERQGVKVSEDDKTRLLRRFERLAPLVQGARILWIDDQPENNVNETLVVTTFGATVDFATTSAEAQDRLERYHVVVSNNARESSNDAGVRFLQETGGVPYTILYVGHVEPERGTPPYAFAITDRPHQLLHYILDVIERELG